MKNSKILTLGEEKIRAYLNRERDRKRKERPLPLTTGHKLKKIKSRKVTRLGFFVTGKATFVSTAFESSRRRH